jgi:hypothetical protein
MKAKENRYEVTVEITLPPLNSQFEASTKIRNRQVSLIEHGIPKCYCGYSQRLDYTLY